MILFHVYKTYFLRKTHLRVLMILCPLYKKEIFKYMQFCPFIDMMLNSFHSYGGLLLLGSANMATGGFKASYWPLHSINHPGYHWLSSCIVCVNVF